MSQLEKLNSLKTKLEGDFSRTTYIKVYMLQMPLFIEKYQPQLHSQKTNRI